MTESEFCGKMIKLLDAAEKWFRDQATQEPKNKAHFENKAVTLGHLASSLRGDPVLGRPTIDEITAVMKSPDRIPAGGGKRLMKTKMWKVSL